MHWFYVGFLRIHPQAQGTLAKMSRSINRDGIAAGTLMKNSGHANYAAAARSTVRILLTRNPRFASPPEVVPDVASKLKESNAKEEKFEDVVKDAQQAGVDLGLLILLTAKHTKHAKRKSGTRETRPSEVSCGSWFILGAGGSGGCGFIE
jgi:hypothetical protein